MKRAPALTTPLMRSLPPLCPSAVLFCAGVELAKVDPSVSVCCDVQVRKNAGGDDNGAGQHSHLDAPLRMEAIRGAEHAGEHALCQVRE